MFVDSHCHLDFPPLQSKLEQLYANMQANEVTHALCVAVDLPHFPRVLATAEYSPRFFASVGVHPDYEATDEPTVEQLVSLAENAKVVAIGETGLDYFRLKGDLAWQRARFCTHIHAARESGLPLIVHTRSAKEDTLRLLRQEHAEQIGGVMHCFTEDWEVAQHALDLGFYISFSGIVTFKNAAVVQEVARRVPLSRLLIETDSPYLAPVPHRGKPNQPAWVRHVAEYIAQLRDIPLSSVAQASSHNFFTLFKRASQTG